MDTGPGTPAQAPASPSLDWSRGPAGQDRNVALRSPCQLPPARHGTFTTWMTELRKRNSPDGCDDDSDAIGNGDWEKRSCCCFPAQPNESRLSCGAELEGSQGEFYHTARKTFSGSIGGGRRQLQALVRLRTIGHSSGPSPPDTRWGTHRH